MLGWLSQASSLLSFMNEAGQSKAEVTGGMRGGQSYFLGAACFVWLRHARLNTQFISLLSLGPFLETQPLAETSLQP